MSNHRQFDPSNGFVALPVGVMDLEMTPGAFRTLVELCRMANVDGYCWPSLEQLSTRLGRSRAALSGYIKELRALGLIDTLRQCTANGYNYRLKYLVTFWSDWRKSLTRKPKTKALKTERSVQQSERIEKTQNHSHKNQTTSDQKTKANPFVESVILKWAELIKGTGFPQFNGTVPENLVRKSMALLEGPAPAQLISLDIDTRLRQLWTELDVDCTEAAFAEQRGILINAKMTDALWTAFEQHMKTLWQPHWRKPPTGDQFRSSVQQAQTQAPEQAQRKLLQSYLKRWEISQSRLHHPCSSPSLAA